MYIDNYLKLVKYSLYHQEAKRLNGLNNSSHLDGKLQASCNLNRIDCNSMLKVVEDFTGRVHSIINVSCHLNGQG